MERDKLELGKRYRDIASGFEGIASSKHEYLNGCLRVALQGPSVEGKIPDAPWNGLGDWRLFDVEQVELVDSAENRDVKGGYTPCADYMALAGHLI